MKKYVRLLSEFKKVAISWMILSQVLAISIAASAAADYSVMQSYTGKDNIGIFIDSSNKKIDDVTCQIGRLEAQEVEVKSIADRDIPLRTVFLLDNSKSISKEYRPVINDILHGLVDAKLASEEFSIATIDTTVHYLTNFTNDSEAIKTAIDSIQYDNQDTYYTDLMYETLKEIAGSRDEIYTRVVVISDGADDLSVGVKGSEVIDIIKASNIPVYSIGVRHKDNEERLKNMFELSRRTNALYYDLGTDSTDNVISGLTKDHNLTVVKITPDVSQLDGSSKSIKLIVNADGVNDEITIDIRMPFGDAEAVSTEIAAEASTVASIKNEEAASVASTEELPEPEVVSEDEESGVSTNQILGALVVLLLGALVLYLYKKKGKDNVKIPVKPSTGNNTTDTHEAVTILRNDSYSDQATVLKEDDDRTILASGLDKDDSSGTDARNTPVTITICVMGEPDSMKRFSLDRRIVIGRKNNLNDYTLPLDKKVSGQHCYIEQKENQMIYIFDLNSTNGLICNGHKVDGSAELSNTNKLTLGNTELEVRILR